jgi:hypothetical protein
MLAAITLSTAAGYVLTALVSALAGAKAALLWVVARQRKIAKTIAGAERLAEDPADDLTRLLTDVLKVADDLNDLKTPDGPEPEDKAIPPFRPTGK